MPRARLGPADLQRLHKLSSHHRKVIEDNSHSGCFYCYAVLVPASSFVTEWCDGGETALCPHCGIDSVIPLDGFSGWEKEEVLLEMHEHYFGVTKERKEMKKVDELTELVVTDREPVDFAQTQKEAYANSVSKKFWEAPPNIPEKLALIHSEISEALEEYRDGHDLKKTYLKNGKPEGFGVELADAVIRIMDLAENQSIDLATLIRIKMRYNATRPEKHGKLC